jgi:hypothetical protein
MANKKGHKAGKHWAAKYIMVNGLSAKNRTDRKLNGRIALTDEQKEAKESLVVTLSGRQKRAATICPKCKQSSLQILPVEYADSPFAWRAGKSLVMLCQNCTG